MIQARGLARRFVARGRTVEAVRGVDLDVGPGELVSFLGPNGAGKTTTLRMLTTLLRPTAGSALVAGCDLFDDPVGVRRRIGYVAQSGGSGQESKVGDEIELQGRLYGMSKVDARRRTGELIEQLDLTGLGDRYVKTLSGGQRRRLDIALGLIHNPKLVFLDEPSTGLDPQSRANLWAHIHRLHREFGVTVFLTTHYLDEADALSQRILIIDNGQLVAEGSPDYLKGGVSGDRITVGVPPAQTNDAAWVASRMRGAHQVSATEGSVQLRIRNGDMAMPALVKELDAYRIPMTSVQVQRPSLDDVFLALTGRSLRDAEAAAPQRGHWGGGRYVA